MNRLLPFACAAALSLTLSGASSQEAPAAAHEGTIAGEWHGEMNNGGLAMRLTLNLYEDGTYVKRVVFVHEYGWTAEGSTLHLAQLVRNGDAVAYASPMLLDMRVNDSSLVTKSGKDSLSLRRVTYPVAQSPLLGRWQGETDLGEELLEDFTQDGQLVVTITLRREAGRYSVGRDEINWWEQIPDPNKRKEKFSLEGDKLKFFVTPKLPAIELHRAQEQIGSK